MFASRSWPKGRHGAPFGLSLLVFGILPTQIGYQDIAALLARQPGVAEHYRRHVLAASAGAMRVATFSFPQPMGTLIEPSVFARVASLQAQELDRTGSLSAAPLGNVFRRPQAEIKFPVVQRAHKGDRLSLARPAPKDVPAPAGVAVDAPKAKAQQAKTPQAEAAKAEAAKVDAPRVEAPPVEMPNVEAPASKSAASPVVRAKTAQVAPAEVKPAEAESKVQLAALPAPKDSQKASFAATEEPLDPEIAAALQDEPFPQFDISLALDTDPQIPQTHDGKVVSRPSEAEVSAALAENSIPVVRKDDFTIQTARLYFGGGSLGFEDERMQAWDEGQEPMLVVPGDPTMKKTALLGGADDARQAGESDAGKGEVTGVDKPLRGPAQRLGLDVPQRAKAEKCLADAVYFEARGEKVRGQIAVAQVVMNRVFSPYYPGTVCGVVYQNAHRRLSCQFTFACDGKPERIEEPDAWERARKIAKATLDGRLWLPEVGKSTHYHAYWVRPSWVREMRRMYKFGVHTFYRPRAWGDGSNLPVWGHAELTAATAAKF